MFIMFCVSINQCARLEDQFTRLEAECNALKMRNERYELNNVLLTILPYAQQENWTLFPQVYIRTHIFCNKSYTHATMNIARRPRLTRCLEEHHRATAQAEAKRVRDRLALDCASLGKIVTVRQVRTKCCTTTTAWSTHHHYMICP